MSNESPDAMDFQDPGGSCSVELFVVAGPHKGRTFSFNRHDSFVVGRSRYAHFRLSAEDPYFSRIHFLLEVNPPCCRLYDMGSTNGTHVNRERVESIDLDDGDIIQAGHTSIRVSLKGNWRQAVAQPGVATMTVGQTAAPSPTIAFDAPGFRLVREIGRGAMGMVYLAIRLSDNREVAIKVIRPMVPGSPEDVQRFLREVSILRRLEHPHIVPFHKAGQAGELLFFVMDYVDGHDVETVVRQAGPLPIDRAVYLVCQILDALDYAHGKGFVHRDVKPANLLVRETRSGGHCMLADFGLARAYQNSPMSGLTIAGDIGGTLPYTPPEQILNFRDAKPAADQYGAAATLYRLIAADFIFDFGSMAGHQQIRQIVYEEPVPIEQRRPEVPKQLAEAIHRALAKEPAARFPDAAAFRQAIAPFAVPRPKEEP
ncbi:MAG: protein kinase [Pirellulales bacterium]|nr:protein kinase [Pirellulales bacterium]